MGYFDRLFNSAQGDRMLNFLNRIADVQDGAWEDFSPLEKEIAQEFEAQRTGKVWRTRFYKFATNTTSAGTKLDDNAGMVAEPSTDTTEGRDDYLEYAVFQWRHCNYTRESDGFAKPTALRGYPGFAMEGSVDIGSLNMTFYWTCHEGATYYDIIMSDTPHPELGLVPWIDAIRADGTVMPYFIVSAYPSVTASDNKPRSQHGVPIYTHSHDGAIDAYQTKGAGYWGAGISRNTLQQIMLAIKYGTKNSQTVFRGHVDTGSSQPKCAVAETNVRRVLIASQGKFYAGCCVSVGSGSNTDRGQAGMHDIVNRARVTKISTVTINGTDYKALDLDIDADITTATSYTVSLMPTFSGETDLVLPGRDGSYLSNADGAHPYRIKGIEYAAGMYILATNAVLSFNADFSTDLLCWPHGSKPAKNTKTGYEMVGVIPAYNANNDDYFVGDIAYDTEHGAWYPSAPGTGDSVGVGDKVYAGGNTASGLKEYLQGGSLRGGSPAGAGLLYRWAGLSGAFWYIASAD